jgi:hypothetical protein
MISIHDIPGNHKYLVSFPAQAAGTAYGCVIFVAPYKCILQSVELVPEAAVTGQATNNFSLALYNRGTDGSGAAQLGSTVTYQSGTNLAETTPTTFFSTETALADGTVLELVKAENGTGMLAPQMLVVVTVRGA